MRRDYFAGSNSGVVGQDVRDVGDPRGAGRIPPAAEFIVGAGAPLDIRRLQRRPLLPRRCRAGATRSRPEVVPFRVYRRTDGALTLGVGTALVQRLVMEQPRPFDVDVTEAALSAALRRLSASSTIPWPYSSPGEAAFLWQRR